MQIAPLLLLVMLQIGGSKRAHGLTGSDGSGPAFVRIASPFRPRTMRRAVSSACDMASGSPCRPRSRISPGNVGCRHQSLCHSQGAAVKAIQGPDHAPVGSPEARRLHGQEFCWKAHTLQCNSQPHCPANLSDSACASMTLGSRISHHQEAKTAATALRQHGQAHQGSTPLAGSPPS